MKPLITIVTITYNSEKYLQQTITSVTSQDYSEIEYVIIDGGSKDSTQSIIFRNSGNIDCCVCEKDSGISDAMNKGILNANGEYILFLHSDDYLISPGSMDLVVEYLDEAHDIFAFGILFKQKGDSLKKRSPVWGRLNNFKTGLLHQGVLCKKDLFEEIGMFDTELKIAMDYDFFLRAYRKKTRVKLIPDIQFSVMRDTGISSRRDWENLAKRLNEEKNVHYKNCSNIFMNIIYQCYWLIYPPYKFLLR